MFAREGLNDCSFLLYELANLDNFRAFVERENLLGFSVTIPYKELVIPWLDELDEAAKAIGAVNSVEVRDGRMIGHNTDAPGFRDTLLPHLQSWHSKALILGTGGASKAVAYVLEQLGIGYRFVSRHPDSQQDTISYEQAYSSAKDTYLIVNSTPVGMYPKVNASPWVRPELLTKQHLCYDLVYNPIQTKFLLDASQQQATVSNGLAMLYHQAELSWRIWNNR